MIRRPPRSTRKESSAASDVYKRQIVGSNGFFVFLLFFHALIGVFGVYRNIVREGIDKPYSQFVAMPSSITPVGIELSPTVEPIDEPQKTEDTQTTTSL